MNKTINRKYFLNNAGSGEKEYFKAPDYAEAIILDKRENEVLGENKPLLSINFVYNQNKPKYNKNQYLLVRSFKSEMDELLDKGYFFTGLIHYGSNRTSKLFTYGKFVQLK